MEKTVNYNIRKDELAAQLGGNQSPPDAVLAATADHHGAKPPDCTYTRQPDSMRFVAMLP